ncbi:MAG TPA: alpha/beta hydrolase [Actinomycetes bacterium]|nr:alpha/beta hydrolase [Actinomycetes bacterium]
MSDAPRSVPPARLQWRHVSVDGRPAVYAIAGHGPPAVFLHGWGLSHRSYRRVLDRLADEGMRVYAPALPRFGGTAELPRHQRSLRGYARWLVHFLDRTGVADPVTLMGHSFGGGVAIQTAHDWPARIERLVIINSIGGTTWTDTGGIVRSLRERPWWDWGLHLQADFLSGRHLRRVLPVIAADAVPNLLRNPRAIWQVAHLARTAELTSELEELKRRRLPVVILWGERDTVIPHAALQSLRAALGDPHVITVPGTHSWLLTDPDTFGEVITNVISVASPDR